mmetsp:Transcript_87632/g.246142  ORF Transcript_87632/g.246142 Transcript_87632/m.246142 type:complete len:203 (+) Transcript_87632:635-1243(+)
MSALSSSEATCEPQGSPNAPESSVVGVCVMTSSVQSSGSLRLASSSSSASCATSTLSAHTLSCLSPVALGVFLFVFFCCCFFFFFFWDASLFLDVTSHSIHGSKGTESPDNASTRAVGGLASSGTAYMGSMAMFHRACSMSLTSCFSIACTEDGSDDQSSFQRAFGIGVRPLCGERKSGKVLRSSCSSCSRSANDAFMAMTG